MSEASHTSTEGGTLDFTLEITAKQRNQMRNKRQFRERGWETIRNGRAYQVHTVQRGSKFDRRSSEKATSECEFWTVLCIALRSNRGSLWTQSHDKRAAPERMRQVENESGQAQ